MNEVTTIKICKETKERLDRLKSHKRETYEDVLRKILSILNITKKNPEKAKRILLRIDRRMKRKLLSQKKLENLTKTIKKPEVYTKK